MSRTGVLRSLGGVLAEDGSGGGLRLGFLFGVGAVVVLVGPGGLLLGLGEVGGDFVGGLGEQGAVAFGEVGESGEGGVGEEEEGVGAAVVGDAEALDGCAVDEELGAGEGGVGVPAPGGEDAGDLVGDLAGAQGPNAEAVLDGGAGVALGVLGGEACAGGAAVAGGLGGALVVAVEVGVGVGLEEVDVEVDGPAGLERGGVGAHGWFSSGAGAAWKARTQSMRMVSAWWCQRVRSRSRTDQATGIVWLRRRLTAPGRSR